MKDYKILIVDDEIGLTVMLEKVFHKEGFNKIICKHDGKTTLEYIQNNKVDLILLDIMLPDMDGFELCKKIRMQSFVPIIFLTAKSSDLDKITGLTVGGDDYITKPFNPLEIVARVKAKFRREESYNQHYNLKHYNYGYLIIDEEAGEVFVNKKSISLPAKEYELLLFFIKNPNQIFTTSEIYYKVWGMDNFGVEKTVSVHINRLRKKIGLNTNTSSPIVNLRGIGYKFVPPKEDDYAEEK